MTHKSRNTLSDELSFAPNIDFMDGWSRHHVTVRWNGFDPLSCVLARSRPTDRAERHHV